MQNGQALLIVLLSMAVVLTVVLSVLSSSVTDIAITTKGEESLRAFSAAEAGIEQALVSGSVGMFSGDIGETTSFSGEISVLAEGDREFAYPVDIVSGDIATIWFVSHADDGSLICDATHPCFTGDSIDVCWGASETPRGGATTPAIEVTVLYANTPGDYSTVRIVRDPVDPNSSRRSSNFFSSPTGGGCTVDGVNYAFRKTVDFAAIGVPSLSFNTSNGLQMARIRMLYNSDSEHPLGVTSVGTLPAQGEKIDSSGTSGEAIRRIEVVQLFSDLPPIFDSGFFTPASIVK